MQRRHLAETALLDEIGGLQPVARREHPVAWSGGAAALDVTEHRHPRLEAGALLDLAAERIADAAEDDVAELVGGRASPATRVLSPDSYVSS